MHFLIADTFTGSLARLDGRAQKAVKTTAFDLQLNPANPSFKFHRIARSRDPGFWSVRVGRDLRLIVHKTASSFMLCYVDHHDDAYRWAERRRIEAHPSTGAAQIVEVRESVEELPAPAASVGMQAPAQDARRLFEGVPDNDLLAVGVPSEWLGDVRSVDEDGLLALAEHLPAEAVEALLEFATGDAPYMGGEPVEMLTSAVSVQPDGDGFLHPDARRRFRTIANVEELTRALDFPWERWTIFLHPVQRRYVERNYNGPARISGSAGTGKTVVALHRAVHQARAHPSARILLTTFSRPLANALKTKLDRLAGNEPDIVGRITVKPISRVGYDLYTERFGQPTLASGAQLRSLLRKAQAGIEEAAFTEEFLFAEWSQVVDAWQLGSWEAYRDVQRLGRKTRIGGRQRELLWDIFETVRGELAARKVITSAQMFARLGEEVAESGTAPFDFAIVDEAQDIGLPELRFLAAIGSVTAPDCLFFTGDLGQRIFQQPFSWKALGVDVRGRSHTLKVNYRTSHQIRARLDRLLPDAIADVDGVRESRRGTVSVFNGPAPEIRDFDGEDEEAAAVGQWLAARTNEGVALEELGVFVRDTSRIKRARAALKVAGLPFVELSEKVETERGKVAVATMHLAKGLEFRAVAVMACDDDVLPQQERIEAITDAADLDEVYDTERHLLYVACTRARDHLLVTGVDPVSEFLEDLIV